jgi:hypothetical protein
MRVLVGAAGAVAAGVTGTGSEQQECHARGAIKP